MFLVRRYSVGLFNRVVIHKVEVIKTTPKTKVVKTIDDKHYNTTHTVRESDTENLLFDDKTKALAEFEKRVQEETRRRQAWVDSFVKECADEAFHFLEKNP